MLERHAGHALRYARGFRFEIVLVRGIVAVRSPACRARVVGVIGSDRRHQIFGPPAAICVVASAFFCDRLAA